MNSATDLERLFKAGISAYQQGDYERAIATLSQLKTCQSSSYRTKASMGLVRVYMGQQNWQQAKALCQKIGTSSKPAVQQWSQKTLDKIVQRMPVAKSVPTTSSGFQPIGDDRDLAARKAASGFQPLTTTDNASVLYPQKTQETKDNQATAAASSSPAQRSVSTPSVNGVTAKASSAIGPTARQHVPSQRLPSQDSADDLPDGVSMFHYAYLNGEEVGREDVNGETANGGGVDIDPAAQTGLPSDVVSTDSKEGFVWPYANRLDKGRALGKIRRGQLWCMQIGGAIAFYFLFRTLIHSVVALINRYLSFFDRILPFSVGFLPNGFSNVTWPLLLLMAVIMVVSPWLWDGWLRSTVGRQTLSANVLRSHSAEAANLIGRYCRQRRWTFPTIHKLPTNIPLIFSYGLLPRNARLIVSQGLLDQLKDDELAALVAYELSHWKSWHWPLLSSQTLAANALLQAHWQLALWGNRQKSVTKWTLGFLATLMYSVFWLARLPGLGMARVRTYYGDRTATEITGNPNGLSRALAKLSFGLAASIEQQGYTPILIEGLLPLLPVATDLSRQQMYGRLPLAELFAWDSQNPLRAWMSSLDTHPPLGDRLRLVMAYAQHWKLAPEIQLAAPPRRRQGMSAQDWWQLWTQSTPYVGFGLGIGIGLLLLGVGAIATKLEWPALDWMHKDMGLFNFCWLLGISLGNIMRINRFFPDLSFSMKPSQDVAYWVSDPALLPASSLPAKLSGKLTGRPGVANWLGQDLMLHTPVGLVKLHFFSVLGPLGNLLNRQKTPRLLSGEPVQVLGWFRRGNHSWLDVDKIRLSNGTLIEAGHPLHSLLLAAIALLAGLWLLMQNSPYA